MILYVCLAAWLPGCLAVWLSGCLAVCLAVWLSGCLAVWLSGWLSDCLTVCLSGCLAVWLSVWLSVCLAVCLSASVSACLYVRTRNIQGWWRFVEWLSQRNQGDNSACRLIGGPRKDNEGVLATKQIVTPPHLRPATLRSKRWTWRWDLSAETSRWGFHVFCSATMLQLLSATCEELRNIPNPCDRSKD